MADDFDADATQPTTPPTPVASVGDGRYRMDAHIATGGMGAVWRAHDTVLERPVAVKLLRPELAGDRSFRARFESEARNAARVQHPGIAAVYDYGEDTAQRRSYLVMELVDGRPLDEIFSAGRLSRTALVGIVASTADVLQAAHDQGLVHRDVKPANILVTAAGQVKVTDFGIAKALADASFTDTGIVLGTPHYLSPEQAAGKPASPASDIYSLGVVLYEGLAGQRPFIRDSPVATALAHLRDEPPPLPADVPPWLATISMAALAKDPAERPASAAAMASALRAQDASAVGGSTSTALLAGGAAAGLAAASSLAATPPTGAVTAPAAPSPYVGAATGATPVDAEPAERGSRLWPVLAVVALLALAALAGVLLLTGGDDTTAPQNPPSSAGEDPGGNGGGNGGDGGGGGGGGDEPSTRTTEPTTEPSTEPTTATTEPTTDPTTEPTTEETTEPTTDPTTDPTTEPTTKPTKQRTPPSQPPTSEPTPPDPAATTPGNSGGGNGAGGAGGDAGANAGGDPGGGIDGDPGSESSGGSVTSTGPQEPSPGGPP